MEDTTISVDTKKENNAPILPLVSVIMPCYNDGKYIIEAVESLCKQTYKEIELIIIDDGSDDPYMIDILNSLNFHNIHIIHTDHIKPAGARNEGIKISSGKYILPLDADDIIEPEYIEKAVEVLENHPEVGIVYCHADLFGAASGIWNIPDYSFKKELFDNCIFVTSLFRKKDWETVGGFCTDFIYGMEDYDFWLSILELGREVVQLPEIYFHYRIKERSRTTDFYDDYEKVQQTYVWIYERHKNFYRRHMDIYCKELRRNLIYQTFSDRKLNRREQLPREWYDISAHHPRMVAIALKIFRIRLKIKFFLFYLLKKGR